MIKVRANGESKARNLKVLELGRVANPGEVFEVSPTRLSVLSGNNRFHAVFVDVLPEEPEIKEEELDLSKDFASDDIPVEVAETVVFEPIDEKPKKPKKKKELEYVTETSVTDNEFNGEPIVIEASPVEEPVILNGGVDTVDLN